MGAQSIQFIKQPYTSGGATVYTPGPGLTHSLTKDGSGNYQLKERNGRTFHFTTVSGKKKLTKIQDLYSKELNVFYDASGRVEFVKDCWAGANQRVLTFVYNPTTGRLDKVYDNTMTPQREVIFGYNAAKQLVSVTDPEGKTWSYEYVSSVVNSEDHRIKRVKDAFTPQRVVVENVYDPLGRVKEQFNEGVAARSWKYHYGGYVTIEEKPPVSPATVGDLSYHYFDRRWRSVGTKDALGNRSSITYDGQDHIVSRSDARGKTTFFEYDGRHNPTKITDPLQKTVQRFYDALDRLDYEDDKNNKRTYYAYQGNLPLVTSITRPYASALTAVEQLQYYPDTSPNYGLLQNHTDPENKVTSYTYDVRGNLWTVTRPAISGQPAAVTTSTYTVSGDVDTVTDARNVVTDYDYNRRRQPTKVTVLQASGNVISETDYDANGKPWKTIDPKLNETTQTYTADGRPLVTTFPPVDGATPFAETVYDVRNYVEKQRNPMQPPEEVVLGYDAAGRLLTQRDPKLRDTTFGYDENGFKGFRTSVTSPLTSEVQKTWFAYNDRGEQTIVTDAKGKQTVTTYDDNGNPDTLLNRRLKLYDRNYYDDNRLKELKTPVDTANNRKTSYEYDKRGLVTKVTEPSGQRIENTVYDNRGRLVTRLIKDAAGAVLATASFTYDPNDNVLTHSEGGVTITRTYDDFNRVDSYTYSEGASDPDNYTINYKYDKNGNLTELTCSAYPGSQKVFYGYDSHNRLTTVTDWANRVTIMGYDLAGRLTSILRPNSTKRVVTYNEAGEVEQIEERGPGGIPFHLVTHTYDSGGRPDIEFAAPVPATVADTSITSPGTVYDADNALSTFNGQTVTRDPDGNMTAGPLNAAIPIAYAYDTRNRLTSVAAQGGAPALSYGYDPAGNRISLTQGATTTRYVVNPAGLSQVLVRNVGGVKTYYVYGPGLLYQIAQDEQTLSYHYDLRGSTIATTGDAGQVINRIQYSTYGRVTQRTGYNAAALVFLFNGSYGVLTDPNGLLHMRARFYNPYTRRFLNADPIGFAGGMNWYAYADGNPISLIDPFGLAAVGDSGWSWFGAATGALGFVGGTLETLASGHNPAQAAQMGIGLAMKYGVSGYYHENGAFSTALMVGGEFLGTTAFAEGVHHVDIGYGTPLNSFESSRRVVGGGLGMVSTAVSGWGAARGLGAANTAAARLGSLTPAQARQIQAFSDRFGAEVNVVGSRAAGTAGPFSDFDYVIGGNSSLRHSAERFLPRNPQSVMGTEAGNLPFRGIDIFNANKTPLDPTRPFIQFTPGQTPVVGPRP